MMRIQETLQHTDPTDPDADADPDPEHWLSGKTLQKWVLAACVRPCAARTRLFGLIVTLKTSLLLVFFVYKRYYIMCFSILRRERERKERGRRCDLFGQVVVADN